MSRDRILDESSSTKMIRVRADARSQYAGQTLRVVEVGHWGSKRSYLCEMPNHPYPGWFRDGEVEDA